MQFHLTPYFIDSPYEENLILAGSFNGILLKGITANQWELFFHLGLVINMFSSDFGETIEELGSLINGDSLEEYVELTPTIVAKLFLWFCSKSLPQDFQFEVVNIPRNKFLFSSEDEPNGLNLKIASGLFDTDSY